MSDDLKDILYRYLLEHAKGRANAIKFQNLGEKISLEPVSWREIAKVIEELRLDGMPIATCGQGTFIPETKDEKKVCLRTIYRRAFHTLRTVRALEKAFGKQIVGEVSEEFIQLGNGQLEMRL